MRQDGVSPFHLAAKNNDIAIMKLLLERRADLDAKTQVRGCPCPCRCPLPRFSLLLTAPLRDAVGWQLASPPGGARKSLEGSQTFAE